MRTKTEGKSTAQRERERNQIMQVTGGRGLGDGGQGRWRGTKCEGRG